MYLPILDLITVHEAMRYIAVRDMTHPVNLFKPGTTEVCRLHNRRPVGELIICKICGHGLPGTRFCTQHLACAGCEAAVATLANSERIGRKHAQKLVRMAAIEHRSDLRGCTEGSCTALLHAAAAEILEESACGMLFFGRLTASQQKRSVSQTLQTSTVGAFIVFIFVNVSGGSRYHGYDPTHPPQDFPLDRHCTEGTLRSTAINPSKRDAFEYQCPQMTAAPTTRNRSRSRTHVEPSSAEQEVAEALLLLTDLS